MSVRPKAWLYLCGGKLLLEKYPDRYAYCLNETCDPKALDDIKKDLHRQFPYHEMFISEDKPGYYNILLVLSKDFIIFKKIVVNKSYSTY